MIFIMIFFLFLSLIKSQLNIFFTNKRKKIIQRTKKQKKNIWTLKIRTSIFQNWVGFSDSATYFYKKNIIIIVIFP
jgi:hypothetical protein